MTRRAPSRQGDSVVQLDEGQRLVAQTVREFVEREVIPVASDMERRDEYPDQLVETMKALGLFGLNIPDEYGGSEMDYTSFAIVFEELARGWMGLAGILGAHLVLCDVLVRYGTDEQKRRFLPRLARGEPRGGLCLSEPDAGKSPPLRIRQLHAAKVAAEHATDPVVSCQAFVHERVVRGHQIEGIAVLADDAGKKQLRLAREGLPQIVVEIRKDVRVRSNPLQVPQLQPLPGEVADERVGARIGQHALDLLRQDPGPMKPLLTGHGQQLIVRNAAPQEERE